MTFRSSSMTLCAALKSRFPWVTETPIHLCADETVCWDRKCSARQSSGSVLRSRLQPVSASTQMTLGWSAVALVAKTNANNRPRVPRNACSIRQRATRQMERRKRVTWRGNDKTTVWFIISVPRWLYWSQPVPRRAHQKNRHLLKGVWPPHIRRLNG